MLSIENDEKMANYLYPLGMDVPDFPMMYLPCLHRNLQNEILMGYVVVGECRCDQAFRDSWMAGITERLMIASYSDTSLMRELAELSFKTRNMEEYLNDNDSLDFDEDRALFPLDQLEPSWRENEEKIAALAKILEDIRGPQYNSAGAPKSFKEYQDWADTRELYMEKYDAS